MAVKTPTRYEPRWDIDLERGQVQEALVKRLVSNGADHLRLEVKGDYRAPTTGNHYVEVRQLGRSGVWRDSGIRTTEADYWAVALPDATVVLVPIAKVRALAEAAVDAGNTRVMERGDNPTEGALIPLGKLL